jgi:dienelactone hydrolase
MPKLRTLVAYYPDEIPSPAGGFPPSLDVLVHLAGSQGMAPKFRSYSYPHTDLGFAEADLESFDKLAASLAWTRTLAAVRKGLKVEIDLEAMMEEHNRGELLGRDRERSLVLI